MDGQNQTQSPLVALVLVLCCFAVMMFAVGQDRTKIRLLDEEDVPWVAVPHESKDIVYYVRIDSVVCMTECLDDDLVKSGAFARTSIMLNNGRVIGTKMTMEELDAALEYTVKRKTDE